MFFVGLFFIASLFMVQKSFAEAAITVGDDVKIKFGVLLQTQLDEAQLGNGDYNQNIMLRRARVLIGGQVAPRLTFFTETEAAYVGYQNPTANGFSSAVATGTKNIETTGLNVLDAVLTWNPIDPLNIDTGLILVPICRNCLQGAAMLMPINYFKSAFVESVGTGTDISRDAGVQLRSYLLSDKLEVRLGAFQGYRTQTSATGSGEAFRVTGRVQYDVFDAEKGLFYTGTYLGKKKVLAIGAGYDGQGDYSATAVDLFADIPMGDMSVTFQVDNVRWIPGQFATAANGGTMGLTSTTGAISDTSDLMIEAGLYHSPTKLMPFVQYEDQQFVQGGPDTKYLQGGIAYYFSGYNGNLKISGGYKDTGTVYTNEVTVQLQGFYF